jgi:hypothetical protein
MTTHGSAHSCAVAPSKRSRGACLWRRAMFAAFTARRSSTPWQTIGGDFPRRRIPDRLWRVSRVFVSRATWVSLAVSALGACSTFAGAPAPIEDGASALDSGLETGTGPDAEARPDPSDGGAEDSGPQVLADGFADPDDAPPAFEKTDPATLVPGIALDGRVVSLGTLPAGDDTLAARWRIPFLGATSVTASVLLRVNAGLEGGKDTLVTMFQCAVRESGVLRFANAGVSQTAGTLRVAVNPGDVRQPLGSATLTANAWHTLVVSYTRTQGGSGPLAITLDGASLFSGFVDLPCDVAAAERFELLVGPRSPASRVESHTMAMDNLVVTLE